MEKDFLLNSKISVIIPVYNEENFLPILLERLDSLNRKDENLEIIVVDGKSTDNSKQIVSQYRVTLIDSPVQSRAFQCNLGAKFSNGKILFFLHADCLPPEDYFQAIRSSVEEGKPAGCFRIRYDSKKCWLKLNAVYKDRNLNLLRFGDQGLFVTTEIFSKCGGFQEDWNLMEDSEIVRRIRKISSFNVLDSCIIVSSRKFAEIGILKLQFSYFICSLLFILGAGPNLIEKSYRILTKKKKEFPS
ncbi:transferase 2, rSAM/selenodomain-associated [Leptospira inadai serovar Lyme str. 10]|uniref:Transferase 2, rSAM/selenodomain-associated n=1 Tax=Leptospira inadai serovar Lyme str. 10 TaxID=1049790 RepID=V6HCG0_9LEPT|nr:transferase 2, rSAM/selenodomain-associated [Leptospira inadai serovar Lyme str. 10]